MNAVQHRLTSRILGAGLLATLVGAGYFNFSTATAQPGTTPAKNSPSKAVKTQPKSAGAQQNTTTGIASSIGGNGQVEVVFALDTTGSMGGLIAGAKQKIWSIVNEIATTKPAPVVKIGFVAYRDKGDEYVTQVHDLTTDLDGAFATLGKLSANGGGDGPEHVNKALHDAVHEIKWSDPAKLGSSVYQVIFLVGDYPPHMDYDDGFDYKKHVREAIGRGIIVNAIRCGNHGPTEPVWQEVARMGEGNYFSIAQEGGMVTVSTPFDEEIAKLASSIEDTTVARGGSGSMAYAAKERSSAAVGAMGPAGPSGAAGVPALADRAEFNAKSGQVYGGWDIVTQVMNGKAKVEELKDEDLPEEMRKMKPEERKKYIDTKIEERKRAQNAIAELQKKRQSYLTDYMAKNRVTEKDSFDVLVKKTIKEQAARRGIK